MLILKQWHCGADLRDDPDTATGDVCYFCKRKSDDDDGVRRNHGQACPRCGVVGTEWCQVWCEEGTVCAGHAGVRRRHPMAPLTMRESRAHQQRAVAAASKAKSTASDHAMDLARSMAASSESNEELAAAIACILKAAQVAALTADTGAGQTVVMAPPDVRPIPAPIGVLRDELMRTLKKD